MTEPATSPPILNYGARRLASNLTIAFRNCRIWLLVAMLIHAVVGLAFGVIGCLRYPWTPSPIPFIAFFEDYYRQIAMEAFAVAAWLFLISFFSMLILVFLARFGQRSLFVVAAVMTLGSLATVLICELFITSHRQEFVALHWLLVAGWITCALVLTGAAIGLLKLRRTL